MSVGDFLEFPDPEPEKEPEGLDIMNNRAAFQAQQEPYVFEALQNSEAEAEQEYTSEGEVPSSLDEQRRIVALDSTLRLVEAGYKTNDPIAVANNLVTWLRDGTLPDAGPEEGQEGHSLPAEAPDDPSLADGGWTPLEVPDEPRMGYDEGLTPAPGA